MSTTFNKYHYHMCVCTVFYGAGGGGKLSAGLKWAVDHAEGSLLNLPQEPQDQLFSIRIHDPVILHHY